MLVVVVVVVVMVVVVVVTSSSSLLLLSLPKEHVEAAWVHFLRFLLGKGNKSMCDNCSALIACAFHSMSPGPFAAKDKPPLFKEVHTPATTPELFVRLQALGL